LIRSSARPRSLVSCLSLGVPFVSLALLGLRWADCDLSLGATGVATLLLLLWSLLSRLSRPSRPSRSSCAPRVLLLERESERPTREWLYDRWILSTSCAADGTLPRPRSPNSTTIELGVSGSSSTGWSKLLGMGVKGGLLDPIPTSGPGMNRGFALGLGLLFVGVAELWLELSREEAESLRNTRMASFRGSTGANVMAGKAFAGAGRGESEPIVETNVDKIMS
jgi:hypothetical protein